MRKTILVVILIGVAVYAAVFFVQAKGEGGEVLVVSGAVVENKSVENSNLVKVSVPLAERQAELKARLQTYSASLKREQENYKQALKLAIASRDQAVAQDLALRDSTLAKDGSESANVQKSVLMTYRQAVKLADKNYATAKSVVESKYLEALRAIGPEPKLSDIPREKVESVSTN